VTATNSNGPDSSGDDSLAKFGYDANLQEQWQEQVKNGTFTEANNLVDAPLLPPPASAIHALPKEGTAEWQELHQLGMQAIANGELGVCVLNGGMATRFGGVVKGIVEVRNHRSFLGLALDNARETARAVGGRIPVYLMNSFATDAATKEHLAANDNFGTPASDIEHFTQFVALRMTPDGEQFRTENGETSPYGPGHGDFAAAFRQSGCLQRFQESGGKYVFVRNVDNLGALASPVVLGHHIRSGQLMTAELAPKWPGDAGGAPYSYKGRVQLVEQLRYPAGFDSSIVDVFNCNTITFTASALTQPIELTRYYVQKKVEGQTVVQIEHLIGELTAHLPTNYLKIQREGPQSRFLPIKVPNDLIDNHAAIEAIYGS
jgi:UTP--glucose-1-phosphate uridylyltransferase